MDSLQSVSVWRTAELSFESSTDTPNPYLDQDVEAVFTGPDGTEIRRPAFWDGGRNWKVRFAPTMPGVWGYTVSSDDATDSGLNRSTGELRCVDDPMDHPIYRHGFLQKGPAGRYLAHADNTPFLWLGDTHWRFTSESWDDANKPGWTSQFRGTVDQRVDQGFTIYQSNLQLYEWHGGPSRYWREGGDFEQLDLAFFQHTVDPRMAYIADRGLVNALGLGWFSAIDKDVEGLQRFARYVVARYGSYPMVWTLGGEVAGYDPDRRQARLDGWREVALTIREADGYDQPRTAHATAERPIAPYYQGEDWLTLTLNQHAHGDFDLSPDHYRDQLSRHPGTPLVEGESMYEGLVSVESAGRRPVTDTMVRQVAYRAIQSGCCGYTYGAQGCWNAAWDRDDGKSMWGDLPWYDGIDLPGATQLGHLRRLYEEVGWHRLRPFKECFSSEYALNNTVFAPNVTASLEMDTVVVYFGETFRSQEGTSTLSLLRSGAYTLRWFDPRTGDFSVIDKGAQTVRGELMLPDKPDGQDWVLVVQHVAS
jgi:Protein of unknown function (DUF4038)/Domain of unknown function (DUF5060)/Putative collagen-binding domain of a collagenase